MHIVISNFTDKWGELFCNFHVWLYGWVSMVSKQDFIIKNSSLCARSSQPHVKKTMNIMFLLAFRENIWVWNGNPYNRRPSIHQSPKQATISKIHGNLCDHKSHITLRVHSFRSNATFSQSSCRTINNEQHYFKSDEWHSSGCYPLAFYLSLLPRVWE